MAPVLGVHVSKPSQGSSKNAIPRWSFLVSSSRDKGAGNEAAFNHLPKGVVDEEWLMMAGSYVHTFPLQCLKAKEKKEKRLV